MKKTIVGFLLIVSICTTSFFFSRAVTGNTVYSNFKVEQKKFLTSPDVYGTTGPSCTNMSGMAIGKTHDSMFIVKVNDASTTDGRLFYYPNFSTSDTCAELTLECAGHANGMAIDDNNIYVTGASYLDSSADYILKIPRSVIAQKAALKFANPHTNITITQSDITFLSIWVGNITTGVPTNEYNHPIGRITCYDGNGENRNGNFIVNYNDEFTEHSDYQSTTYTRAKLVTYNNQEILLLSEDYNHVFLIENTIVGNNPIANANICYSSTAGFFDPKFIDVNVDTYGRRTKNVILWADIDQTASVVTLYKNQNQQQQQKNYRRFTPDKINLNLKNAINPNVNTTDKMYMNFEIESMAFDDNADLYFAANAYFTKEEDNTPYRYYEAYRAVNNGKKPIPDGVFMLTLYANDDINQQNPLSWTV